MSSLVCDLAGELSFFNWRRGDKELFGSGALGAFDGEFSFLEDRRLNGELTCSKLLEVAVKLGSFGPFVPPDLGL